MSLDNIKTTVLVNPKTGREEKYVSGNVAGRIVRLHMEKYFRYPNQSAFYARYSKEQARLKNCVDVVSTGTGHGVRYLYSVEGLKRHLNNLKQ